jgi:uncharacterized protein (TIRG00374 family)
VLKIALSLAIIGYIFYKAAIDGPTPKDRQEKWDAFLQLVEKFKHFPLQDWGVLAAGFGVLLVAVVITLVRWWYLVRAVGIDLPFRDALRIGFLGCLFNLAPTGIVGGDVLKALMLGREKPGNRAKALASVVVDRIIGLYVLFLVAAAGVFVTGFWNIDDPWVHGSCRAVLIVTLGSTVGIALILIPGFLEGPLVWWMTRIPKVGGPIRRLFDAIRIYRSKGWVLIVTTLMTFPVHGLLTVSLWLLAVGLRFDQVPGRDYWAIYPMSGILSIIPLSAGPAESGIVFLYTTALWRVAGGALATTSASPGLILALMYRLSTLVIVPIGAVYYFHGGRKEVTEVLHEGDAAEPPDASATVVV